jgi:hypothetical protein
MALDHLRLRLPAGVEAVERVEHQVSVIAGRPVAGDHWVEHAEIGHPDKD